MLEDHFDFTSVGTDAPILVQYLQSTLLEQQTVAEQPVQLQWQQFPNTTYLPCSNKQYVSSVPCTTATLPRCLLKSCFLLFTTLRCNRCQPKTSFVWCQNFCFGMSIACNNNHLPNHQNQTRKERHRPPPPPLPPPPPCAPSQLYRITAPPRL